MKKFLHVADVSLLDVCFFQNESQKIWICHSNQSCFYVCMDTLSLSNRERVYKGGYRTKLIFMDILSNMTCC